MGYASRIKSTGKLIEYQSNGNFDTLLSNAINYGFLIGDIEIVAMSDIELRNLLSIERSLLPDWKGFSDYCLNILMGNNYLIINPLLTKYPCFEMAINHNNGSMLRAEITRAENNLDISNALAQQFRDACVTFHIP